ncbi:DivIVA domain-containing protein [Brevibacterium atlanticum]|uniref:DivIVA domain-containing protein n=1 Tax=Brevibacterium atlanticum TaxID=2697563 RepID=UPI0014244963|nr:DivIVA domain-containing protein [Brevibacterium atlanticum]
MPVWIVIGVAAAIFVLVIVIAASFDVFSSETRDEAEDRWTGLPEDFTSDDLAAATFRPALRGYRMDDVDEAMAVLQDRLRELEAAVNEPSAAPPETWAPPASSAAGGASETPAAAPTSETPATAAPVPSAAAATDGTTPPDTTAGER